MEKIIKFRDHEIFEALKLLPYIKDDKIKSFEFESFDRKKVNGKHDSFDLLLKIIPNNIKK